MATGLAVLTRPAIGATSGASERTLGFYNTHTGERLSRVYWADGNYVPEALGEIDVILRDHRNGEVKEIDRGLLDLLHRLGERLESGEVFHVISGYRSPATNQMLLSQGAGVAKKSMHLEGKAIDIRLPDRPLEQLHAAAVALEGGGVGYYPKPEFVHVDVGRVRYW
jgi:uncharacterized protein YcbK (DUF882 family)